MKFKYISPEANISSWDDLQPLFQELQNREINSVSDLEEFILHYSELIALFDEKYAWSYINMSCHTENKDYVQQYELFSSVIAPKASKVSNIIDKIICESPFAKDLDMQRYSQLLKGIQREIDLFVEENIPIDAELSKLSSKFEQTAGALTANIENEDIPLPLAAVKLQSSDSEKRKATWFAIFDSRFNISEELNDLYSEMVALRHKTAVNAGYENYRDFKHDMLKRFDYTPQDTLIFHDAIEKYVVPISRKISEQHCETLGIDIQDYRPWDTLGVPTGQNSLKPFSNGEELLQKSVSIFTKIKPEFGDNLKKMDASGLFDLDSRKGKAPGGYNYPLEATGMPFIFMNSAGTQRNVVTMMHEGGHAMHTFLCNNEPLVQYRETPSEMAETASMSMELISSSNWRMFYSDADFIRARREHLEGIINLFPWCATVDAFQHWVYQNPTHKADERNAYFVELLNRFFGTVNWDGLEKYQEVNWQRQSHIFGVPFYYIEYAIAQLGALQVYQNYKENAEDGLNEYIKGLSLGSSKPLPEVWNAMGIKFDFSESTIKNLMEFVQTELGELN